jgi:hypothetical protein
LRGFLVCVLILSAYTLHKEYRRVYNFL